MKKVNLKMQEQFNKMCDRGVLFKVEENEKANKALEVKTHNQKIMGKISIAEDSLLDGLTVEELKAQLK